MAWLKKFKEGKGLGLAGRWPFCAGRAAVVCVAALLLVALLGVVLLASMGESWRDAIALREAEGKGLKVEHFVRWGLWRAALINLLLALGLLASWKLWWGRAEPSTAGESPVAPRPPEPAGHRRWWLVVLVLVVLAAGIRWPRMDLSLYNDEVAGFSRYIAGSFKDGAFNLEDESPAPFVGATWMDTLWGNRMANNHVLHSVIGRTAYDALQAASGGVEGQVRETPLRLPALLGGLISIVAVAGLGRAIGLTTGGLFAALLLAVHPWHLRYSTEARGYGLVLGLGVLAAWCLVEALRGRESGKTRDDPRWSWWWGYALCQSGYLLSNVGSIYLAAGINGVTLLGLAVWALRRDGLAGPLVDRSIRRLLVANVVSAMLLMPLMLPALPQIQSAMARVPVFAAGIPFGFWPDVLSNFAIGMPWYDGDPENRWNPAVLKYAGSPATWIGLTIAAVSFVMGLVVIVRRGGVAALVIVGALLGLLLAWLSSHVTGATLLPWYVVFALPFVVLCSGVGIGLVASWIGSKRRGEMGTPVTRWIGYGLIALVVWAAYPALSSYQLVGKQALRNVIVQVRGGVYPFADPSQKEPIVVGWWTEAGIYDPRLRLVWQVEQLEWVREKALREGRLLYFILGKREAAVEENAAVVEILEKSGWFELLKVYSGLEQRAYREHLFRLRPSPRLEKPSSDEAPRPSLPTEVALSGGD